MRAIQPVRGYVHLTKSTHPPTHPATVLGSVSLDAARSPKTLFGTSCVAGDLAIGWPCRARKLAVLNTRSLQLGFIEDDRYP